MRVLTTKSNVLFFVLSSCRVDPHQCANHCGDDNRLLLHSGTAALDLDSIQDPGLEVADSGRVPALLCIFSLLMVRLLVGPEQSRAAVS